MTKAKLNRRTLLRSAALGGIAIGLPPLEAMVGSSATFHGRALAQTSTKRLLVFQFPNGVFLPDWIPQGIGNSWQPSLLMAAQTGDGFTGPSVSSIRSHINVITGLSNSRLKHDAHETPNASFLTGTSTSDTWVATGPSIETVVGNALGADTHFPALRVGLNDSTNTNLNIPLSYSDGSQVSQIAPVVSPSTLYASLLGFIQPAGTNTTQTNFPRDFRVSVLDYVQSDIQRVRNICGVGDRRVLDEHLESIREIERRISALQPVTCDRPNMDAEIAQLPNRPAGRTGVWPSSAESQNYPLRSDVMMRLTTLALRCDLTRSVFFTMGSSNCRQTYPFLNMGNIEDHEFSHLQSQPGSRDTQLQWNRANRWKLSQFARMIELLAQPDGTGRSLLDETIVVCGSELANGAGHTADFLPIVVAGNLGPMAQSGGRNQHIVVPCNSNSSIFNNPGGGGSTPISQTHPGLCQGGYTPMSNLWLTVLQALGINRSSFGDSTGTISGLWL